MGLGSEIRDPEKTYSGSRIQGSKRHRIPDPRSGSASLGISKLQFWMRKYIQLFSAVNLLSLKNHVSGFLQVFSLKCWIRILNQWIRIRNTAWLRFVGILNEVISGLHEGRPSYMRSLEPSKNTQQFNILNSLFLCYFVDIFVFLDPDPADHNQCGSISTTLVLAP